MDRFDVVVAGAGIHGAGVTQAVAAAGHSVLLLEKDSIAAGTSSRSSKLVHGGLRYLESGQFRLVYESLAERATLCRIAPELVSIKPFYIPVYADTRRRPWQLRAGLSLYALLGGLHRDCRFAGVAPGEWDRLDSLNTDGLQHVFRYFDAQTDDRLLTQAVVASAVTLGAQVAVPARLESAEVAAGGVAVRYRTPAGPVESHARVLVNAGGPWADRIAASIRPERAPPALDLVQGTHLLLPGRLEQGVYYVESPTDGRAVFLMPRGDHALLGTTENAFHGDPDDVAPLPREIDYLLAIAKHYFARYRDVTAADVLDSTTGLRVLPAGRGAAFRRSRETVFDADDAARPRTLSIYGGKLTTYRATAARALQRIAPSLPAPRPRGDTRTLPLVPP